MLRVHPLLYLFIGLFAFSLMIIGAQQYLEMYLPKKISASHVPIKASVISAPQPDIDLPSAHNMKPTHTVNFSFLNVRKEATIFSPVIATLHEGDDVTVFEKVNRDWSRIVIHPSGKTGYAANRYLSLKKRF